MRRYAPILILLGGTAVFALGIWTLFEWRFASGDVYPPYSSLRADPLGTMALYESLGKMPGLSVSRDFSILNRLPEEPGTTYLHLAAEPYEWNWLPDDVYREVKRFVVSGGRLVITYYPQTHLEYDHDNDDEGSTNNVKKSAAPGKPAPAGKKEGKDDKKKKKKKKDEEEGVDLTEKWGFHEGFEPLAPNGDVYEPVAVVNKSGKALPPVLQWHSGMIFTNCAGWRTIYARGTNAVVIEKSMGRGSVVIAGDSFFVSNEAMARDRHADLLAWLIGPHAGIVFDEAHLGITESSSVAILMRKYHLHGLAAGLLLLAVLFIWKNSASLVPAQSQARPEEVVAGKDATSGFVNLLRRSIAPRELFRTCFAEWKKSVAPSGRFSTARLRQAEQIFESESSLPPNEHNPVASYQKISATLKKL